MLINVLDGYDLQAAAFTSTSIMAEWGVAPGAMGLTIFSVGVLGVGLGSFVLAPIADRFGRRPTVLIGLLLITVGMLAVSVTATPLQLSGLRFLTGLGIGILLSDPEHAGLRIHAHRMAEPGGERLRHGISDRRGIERRAGAGPDRSLRLALRYTSPAARLR